MYPSPDVIESGEDCPILQWRQYSCILGCFRYFQPMKIVLTFKEHQKHITQNSIIAHTSRYFVYINIFEYRSQDYRKYIMIFLKYTKISNIDKDVSNMNIIRLQNIHQDISNIHHDFRIYITKLQNIYEDFQIYIKIFRVYINIFRVYIKMKKFLRFEN